MIPVHVEVVKSIRSAAGNKVFIIILKLVGNFRIKNGQMDKVRCTCFITDQKALFLPTNDRLDKQETRNPEQETRNKKPGTRNKKQETRNKKQEARNPEQETRNLGLKIQNPKMQ
jgi:hypothetical protein